MRKQEAEKARENVECPQAEERGEGDKLADERGSQFSRMDEDGGARRGNATVCAIASENKDNNHAALLRMRFF